MRWVSRGRDGSRPVHRGLIIALFVLMGIWFVARGVEIAVDARTVARDGRVADGVVLAYRHTPYAGSIGRVYVANPIFDNVPLLAMREHEVGEKVTIRYVYADRLMAAEDGAPLNVDAMLLWLMLGTAVLVASGWATASLYREQAAWAKLEADLLAE